ncbi:hypothetical protein ACFXJ5_13440 [Streptomyces sp. NPDC059373]
MTGLDPVTNTLFAVSAFAVALVGRLRSFGATAAAGIGLGMLRSLVLNPGSAAGERSRGLLGDHS